MASLLEVHEAIKACLLTVDTLNAFDHPPQGAQPPVAFVALNSWIPAALGRQTTKTYQFDVFVFTAQSVQPVDGYHRLMRYADSATDESIELAIWDGNVRASSTFGGLVDTEAVVSEFRVLGVDEVDAFQMYGGVFTVQVRTRGDA